MAMKVSLCGPHSLETSTFVPVDALTVAAENASGPFCEMYVNLSHQVGFCWVLPASAGEASASAAKRARICMDASGKRTTPVRAAANRHQNLRARRPDTP